MSEAEDLLALLVHHLQDGVWLLDSDDSSIVEVSRSGAVHAGSRPESLVGASFASLIEPQITEQAWQLLLAQIPASGSHAVLIGLRCELGQIQPVELTLTRDDSCAPEQERVLAITRAQFPDSLPNETGLEVDALLDRALEALGEGVVILNHLGCVERANTAFLQLVDLQQSLVLDHSVFDPPWIWQSLQGDFLEIENTPPVLALRTGQAQHLEHVQLRGNGLNRVLGELVSVRVSCEPLIGKDHSIRGAVLVLSDLTALLQSVGHREQIESTDQLTSLRSRHHITAQVDAAVRSAQRSTTGSDDARVGVLHVDLDDFRSVNDTFGTAFGDEVLIAVADRLRDLTERHIEIGRVGVDEFLVVITGNDASLSFDTRLRRLAEELQRRIEQPLVVEGLELRLTASVGISRYPANAETGASLVRAADTALAASRREGRHQVRFFESSLEKRGRTGLALDRDLRLAAAQRNLQVYYQPIIDLQSGAVMGAEALVRWNHPEHGPIPPSVFIPDAEATGAISAISDMVVTTVAEDLAGWNQQNLLKAGSRIAINISATEFEQRGFVQRLAATLDNVGVLPSQLELEITETLLMRDVEVTAQRLGDLHELGFLVSLDDFGTGYSSLSHLHRLPLHTLKVDRCFVSELGDGRSETITRAILNLAQGLGIHTVGEGVETEEQRRFLIDSGCDSVQGFFYAPPLPRLAFEKFMLNHRPVSSASTTTKF
ncbi:MAG: EAL domain-containing protein [Actinomycetes bacterium]